MVGSIEGDAQGGLWLGTNLGLAQLKIRADETLAAIRIYTTADGLSDNFLFLYLHADGIMNFCLEGIKDITVFS